MEVCSTGDGRSGVIVSKRHGPLASSGSFSSSQQMVFYPSLPVIESTCSPPSSPLSVQVQMRLLEQSMGPSSSSSTGGPVRHHHHKALHSRSPISPSTSSTAMGERKERTSSLSKSRGEQEGSTPGSPSSPQSGGLGGVTGTVPRTLPRPLERTHSAPLPLGHPMLTGMIPGATQVTAVAGGTIGSPIGSTSGSPSSQQAILDSRALLKQHIRQTVLHRASSKQQL